MEYWQKILQRMDEEERLKEKVDDQGCRWTKVYLGGGTHFQSWLNQVIELKGEANVEVEEVDSEDFQCYKESGEKMYRIWVKETPDEKQTKYDNTFYQTKG